MARTLRFLALSLFIHGILIAFFKAKFPHFVASKTPPVKIRIVEIPKKPAPPPAPAPAPAPALDHHSTSAPRRAQRQKPAPAKGASAPPQAPKTYGDLFPTAQEGLASAERADAPRRAAASSFDPEGDAYSLDTQHRNLARLDQFATALAGRFSIPDGVKKLVPTGQAFVRLTKTSEGWKVVHAAGDPYYRALLFEVLASQPPGGYLFRLLDETDYPMVRIYFSLVPVWSNDEAAKPLVARTASNKVFLDFTHFHVDEKWQMLMAWNDPISGGAVAANIIGIGTYLWGKATETEASDDLDVKKLRLSPAFSRPIGR